MQSMSRLQHNSPITHELRFQNIYQNGGDTGAWQIVNVHRADLFDPQIGVKVELEGSNRELCREGLLVD